MGRLFGTDGVRGLANGDTITVELSLGLAQAAATVLGESARADGQKKKKERKEMQ